MENGKWTLPLNLENTLVLILIVLIPFSLISMCRPPKFSREDGGTEGQQTDIWLEKKFSFCLEQT